MKQFKYLSAAALLLTLGACSSDEPGDNGKMPVPTTDVAYISINISDVNNPRTKATSGDEDFEYGSSDEYKVTSAKFFFFDEDKNFVLEADVWNGGNAQTGDPNGNIEYIGKNVLVLENLKEKGYPKYLLTVLNAPDDLKPEVGVSTIESVRKQCCDIKNGNNFIMTTSTYDNGSEVGPFGVTELKADDFKVEPKDDKEDTSAVQVYVERLAAKVRLKVNGSDAEEIALYSDKTTKIKVYKIKASVSGNINEDGEKNEENGGQVEGITKLYISIDGWGLTNYEAEVKTAASFDASNNLIAASVSPRSYLSKILEDEDGKFYTPDGLTNSNALTNFRSYWAMSPSYSKTVTPGSVSKSSTAVGVGLFRNDYTGLDGKVFPSTVTETDKSDNQYNKYLSETTNTIENVAKDGKIIASNVASILVKSTVYALVEENDEKYLKPADMIRWNGLLYLNSSFKAHVLQTLNANNKLNVYVKTAEGDEEGTKSAEYKQLINVNCLKIAQYTGTDARTGQVIVKVDETKFTTGINNKLYSKDDEGSFNEIENAETAKTSLISEIEDFAKPTATDGDRTVYAYAYNNGQQFYSIPIEHYATTGNKRDITNVTKEGEYGVVRNHIYQVTITKVGKIGTGIFNPGTGKTPGEPIIPDDPSDSYYLGAKVNILSWKMVNQEVEL